MTRSLDDQKKYPLGFASVIRSSGYPVIQFFIFLIRAYQLCLSPLLGTHCRFEPSCSHYAQDAIMQHGVMRGFWLAIRRLLRCHPFGESGYDPVPPL